MEIHYHDSLPSTHLYLKEALGSRVLSAPIAIVAEKQSAGVGSRGSLWEAGEGNLYLSFALDVSSLPKDIALGSLSLYFSFLMCDVLRQAGSEVWLKWPNDFYLGDAKVGGMITAILARDVCVISLGLNLKSAARAYATLDVDIEREVLLQRYFSILDEKISWQETFMQYQVEFEKSRCFFWTDKESKKKSSLQDAVLLEDGSIMIDNKRIYSLR